MWMQHEGLLQSEWQNGRTWDGSIESRGLGPFPALPPVLSHHCSLAHSAGVTLDKGLASLKTEECSQKIQNSAHNILKIRWPTWRAVIMFSMYIQDFLCLLVCFTVGSTSCFSLLTKDRIEKNKLRNEKFRVGTEKHITSEWSLVSTAMGHLKINILRCLSHEKFHVPLEDLPG